MSETLVRNALREARALGLVTIEERRVAAWRNSTNVVRIVSVEWSGWLKLAKGRPGLLRLPVDLPRRGMAARYPERVEGVGAGLRTHAYC